MVYLLYIIQKSMKKIGFIISEKENENRRAFLLEEIRKIKNKKNVYFQEKYGEILGYTDKEIIKTGCNVVNKDTILKECDIICDPKIGDSEDLLRIKNKIIFGWIHATQNYETTQKCKDNKLTVYAWEKMFEKNRHVFFKNNQIAGKAAILHAMLNFGEQFKNMNVAILGRGNTAMGAYDVLKEVGANITMYSSNMEELFKTEMGKYDIIVNCVLWDVSRKDHIICKKDLKKLKKNALIIDISCDKGGAIETSIPTTIQEPIYNINGITHYVVDHTPSLLYKEASKSISVEVIKYIDKLMNDEQDDVLKNALIIEKGKIIDDEINKYQNREE